jgi:hypothetical protein
MTDALPDGYVVHLPPPANQPAPRHVFPSGGLWVPAHKTLTRLAQTERTCTVCSVVKVTVHEEGGGARREWRWTEHGEQFAKEPACTGSIGAAP